MRRCEKEETRRNVQSELFHVRWKKESDKWRSQWDLWMVQLGGVPATLIGLERAVRYNGKPCIILKQLQDTEDRYQVKLENGRMLSVEAKNVRTDRAIPIRGAIVNAESDTLGSRDYYAWQHAAIRRGGAHSFIVNESDNLHCSGDKTKVFGREYKSKRLIK